MTPAPALPPPPADLPLPQLFCGSRASSPEPTTVELAADLRQLWRQLAAVITKPTPDHPKHR